MQAGKQAGDVRYVSAAIVVWVPDPNTQKPAGMVTEKADQILDSLENFIQEPQWGLPP